MKNHSQAPSSNEMEGSEFKRNWAILLAATVGSAAGFSSLPFYSLGSFITPLHADFGWSRSEITLSFLYATIVIACISPFLGAMIDRYGVRLLAMLSIPGLAGVFVLLSNLSGSIHQIHILYGIAALLGAATTPINYTKAVNSTFEKNRGLALGISQSGIAIAAIGIPLLLASVISKFGWRGGYMALALLALLPLPFIIFGLKGLRLKSSTVIRTGYKPLEAFKKPVFWVFGISFAMIAVAVSALVVHLVPMLRDSGVEAMNAAKIASVIGIGVLIGRLITGYLIDHFFAPFVATALFVAAAVGCLILYLFGAKFAIISAILIGLALGAEADLIAYISAKYFGMANYGAIYSVIYSLFLIGAASGPALAGFSYDQTGNYKLTLIVVTAILFLSSICIARLPRFEKVSK